MADILGLKHESSDDYFERLDATFSALEASRPAQTDAPRDSDPVGPTVIAETFAALLAAEEGASAPKPMRLVAVESQPQVTEALVEEVTRRVLERMAPDTVRAVVADIVSEVSERLVKEEIARIRKGPNA